jgi:hypothetical protein
VNFQSDLLRPIVPLAFIVLSIAAGFAFRGVLGVEI